MKTILTILLVGAVMTWRAAAQETATMGATENPAMAGNLFRNGDMSNGTMGWQGDRTFATDDDNRVLVVKAKKNSEQAFSQSIKTDKLKDVIFKFRYKTADYKGRGLELRVRRNDNSYTYRDQDLTADGKWHDMTWNFSQVRDHANVVFVITVKEGQGTVLFDDIIAVEKKESASQ
ncbi:MAG: hypothetical protein LBK71_05430 [Verrucomicrobiales bacterium]|jgi:hypothetical protein|nr:hypothetical protein [Verrucomicrobiales bacterium]